MPLGRVPVAFMFDALTNVKMDNKVISENSQSQFMPRHEREGEQILPW